MRGALAGVELDADGAAANIFLAERFDNAVRCRRRGGEIRLEADFVKRPRGFGSARDRPDFSKRRDETFFAPGSLRDRQQTAQTFAGQPDDVFERSGDELIDPDLGIVAVFEIEDLDKRTANHATAGVLDHAGKKIELPAFRNEDTKTVESAHVLTYHASQISRRLSNKQVRDRNWPRVVRRPVL